MGFIVVEIEQIVQIYNQNKEEIMRLQKENIDLMTKYFFLTFGVKVGDIVKFKYDGKLYKITRFNFNCGIEERPRAFGNIIKKDGSLGVEHDLFTSWEKVKP